MLKISDVREAGVGLVDKSAGLVMEVVGTVVGSDRLKDAGRHRQEAGSERLFAIEEDAKATRYAGEAEASEQRQRANQDPRARSKGRGVRDQASAGSAVAENVKGAA